MPRGMRRQSATFSSILEEAERNLLTAFNKSALTKHKGLKGDARANRLASFLEKRLPSTYGVLCKGEVVDNRDQRSGEIDIIIFDKLRNAMFSEDPLWVPAEALLAYVEVKTTLTRTELRKSYEAANALAVLRPFGRVFTLAEKNKKTPETTGDSADSTLRCFRTIFAYKTDLKTKDWLANEWGRVQEVVSEIGCDTALIDRILVLNRGMINPPFKIGTDASAQSVFQQWFVNFVNFLSRENGRREAVDWQTYSAKTAPGWKQLP